MSRGILGLLLVVALTLPDAAHARPEPIAAADSFRIGNAGVTCTALRRSEDEQYRSMFDRAYDVVCRDAASPVGRVYVLDGPDRQAPAVPGSCGDAARVDAAELPRLPGLTRRLCHDDASGLSYIVYRQVGAHGRVVVASGLAAYQSALYLGLASLALDRKVDGAIAVAVTGSGEASALARIQAEQFSPAQALAAGMGRANNGDHADAVQFFDRLDERARRGESGADRPALYLAGQAIEQSQLGNHASAEVLFTRASKAGIGPDPVFGRLFRNLYAMHRLDMGDAAGAITTLAAPLPPLGDEGAFADDRLAAGYIDHPLSQRLSIDDAMASRFGDGAQPLTDRERAALLDAQALYIAAEAHRLAGRAEAALRDLEPVPGRFNAVRGGRVLSMAWLIPDVYGARAQIAEAAGQFDIAGRWWDSAVAAMTQLLPDSAALLKVRARAAGFASRHGNADAAMATYAELVALAPKVDGGSDALRGELDAYFMTLAAHADRQGAVEQAFAASQAMVRPGVAQTQAVLARELSAGSDEAAGLFRQSLSLARDIRSIDQELAGPAPKSGSADAAKQQKLVTERADLAQQQTAIQARLAAFKRYTVVADQTVTVASVQATLHANEAYFKLLQVGEKIYGFWIESGAARLFAVGLSPSELETLVNRTRDSIVSYEGNQIVTSPFDLDSSHKLYTALLGPVEDRLAITHHVIFEPDGAMLKLPLGVLVGDRSGIVAYDTRAARADGDPFDFTGIAWFARQHLVSTAASARAFVDLRATAPSDAHRTYLGLGHNALPPQGRPDDSDPCGWPRSTWLKPISAAELSLASTALGGNGNAIVTDAAFTDSGISSRTDLADFRVIQFATHGLVTAPHPGCAANPALVTSFGDASSGGLLTFRSIFDLRLNADTVILSACDTAGSASIDATRAAGISTGGNFALDGLVRAFVGAGARSVVASHWPVPDDFHATTRLMGGLFRNARVAPLGESLRQSQIALMDDPLTSHPYYWAAFAIVGDAARPVTQP